MLPPSAISGDRELYCPYDKTHVIVAKSFNAHLLRCRRNHPDVPMVACRFDKNHIIHKPEKAYHESQCPSQYLLDRERQKLAGDSGLRGDVKGPPIVADHKTAFDNEDWGACAPVRTPALFNKTEPREDFIGPYMPGGLAQGQGNQSVASHGLPHTSSMAAGMASMVSKRKALPSHVFEYTSSYGRGRGKISAPSKLTKKPSVHPTTTTDPEKGQFEDTSSESETNQRQLFAHNSNLIQTSPNLQSSAPVEKDEKRLELLKEREQKSHEQLNQLKLLHMEEQEKLSQEHQLQIVQLEKNFALLKQQLLMRQGEQTRQLEERLHQLQEAVAAAALPSAPPPGFSNPGLPATSASDSDVSNKTSAAALQKERDFVLKDEESWHGNQSDVGFSPFPPGSQGSASERNVVNSMGLTGSQNVNHVTNWLSAQHIDDIDDHDALVSEAESSSESQKMKRKLEKKLRQINLLEQKVSLGHKLSKPEEDKLNQKADVITQLAALDCTLP